MTPTASPPIQPKLNPSPWLPMIEPAVTDDSCAVDSQLLLERAMVISTFCLAWIGVTMLIAGANSSTANKLSVAIPVIIGSSMIIDSRVADMAANEGAINQYLTMQYPTEKATYRIKHELSAAQLLVDKGGDLNKLDENGSHLLWPISNPDVFKLFVDHGINLKGKDQYGVPLLQRIANLKNPNFLEYVLAQNKVTAADFTPSEQVNIWLSLSNFKAGPMLARHGFDVNVRDDEGFTPLQRLAEQGIHICSWDLLGLAGLAQALLESGADPSLTVKYLGSQKTALQIVQNPRLRNSGHPQIQEVLMRYNSGSVA